MREQHTLKLWEVSGMTEVTNAATGGQGFNSYPTFSPDGKVLAVDAWSPIQIFAVPSLGRITNFRGFNPAFSTDGRSIVHAAGRRILRRDSPVALDATNTVIGELSSNIICLALSPDGNLVVCSDLEDDGRGVRWSNWLFRPMARNLPAQLGMEKSAFGTSPGSA
jgi:Tol biopolymer transport system component